MADYDPTEDCEALDLSQVGLARLVRVNERTARRWFDRRNDQDVPRAVELALKLMRKHGEDPAIWMPPPVSAKDD